MTTTDRAKIKNQQKGVLTSAGLSDVNDAVSRQHRRTRSFTTTDASNAATNVAQTLAVGYQHHKVKARGIGIAVGTNVATNNTDYDVFKFYKTVAGVSTLIGTWNTHGSAQGAIIKGTPALVTVGAGLITNSDAEIAVGGQIDYAIDKYGAGKAVAAGTVLTFDLEEI